MPCENYREPLTDAAANGSAPSHALQLHLVACQSCRAFFAEEQQLFSAIHSGVRTIANAELPASFLPRVRAGLSERRISERSWFPLGAAVATVAVLLVIVFIVRDTGRSRPQPTPGLSAVTHGGAPTEGPGISAPLAATRTATARRHNKPRSPRVAIVDLTPDAVVLIPSGQKEAVDALLIALKTGAVDGDILVADKSAKAPQDVEPRSLSIPPIEIKPLAPVSQESASDGEKTRR
ncbi:MAG TPA: hypothetical protein VJN42_11515 [Candidatus Acidoferrum sp.]|nr:hypothetical protein [Candidatus Acidoferrum sp.]